MLLSTPQNLNIAEIVPKLETIIIIIIKNGGKKISILVLNEISCNALL